MANNNINITKAMYLLLFYTWDKLPFSEKNPFNYFQAMSISMAIKNDEKTITKEIDKHPTHSNFRLNVQNTYQTMGVILKIAAIENMDGCLIEDLHYNEIDELLQLKQNGLRSVAFLALN